MRQFIEYDNFRLTHFFGEILRYLSNTDLYEGMVQQDPSSGCQDLIPPSIVFEKTSPGGGLVSVEAETIPDLVKEMTVNDKDCQFFFPFTVTKTESGLETVTGQRFPEAFEFPGNQIQPGMFMSLGYLCQFKAGYLIFETAINRSGSSNAAENCILAEEMQAFLEQFAAVPFQEQRPSMTQNPESVHETVYSADQALSHRLTEDAKTIVMAYSDGRIRTIDIETGEEKTHKLQTIVDDIAESAVSADGRYLLTKKADRLFLHDLQTMKTIKGPFKAGINDTLLHFSFLPELNVLLVKYIGGLILFNGSTLEATDAWGFVGNHYLNPDGVLVVETRIIDDNTQELQFFKISNGHSRQVHWMTVFDYRISADGSTLVGTADTQFYDDDRIHHAVELFNMKTLQSAYFDTDDDCEFEGVSNDPVVLREMKEDRDIMHQVQNMRVVQTNESFEPPVRLTRNLLDYYESPGLWNLGCLPPALLKQLKDYKTSRQLRSFADPVDDLLLLCSEDHIDLCNLKNGDYLEDAASRNHNSNRYCIDPIQLNQKSYAIVQDGCMPHLVRC